MKWRLSDTYIHHPHIYIYLHIHVITTEQTQSMIFGTIETASEQILIEFCVTGNLDTIKDVFTILTM